MRSVVNNALRRAWPLALLLLAQGAHAETLRLEELEARALVNRGSVAAARARVNGAEARIALAKVPYYPTLVAKGDVLASPGGRLVEICETGASPPCGNTPSIRVSGAHTIDQPGAFTPIPKYDATLSLQSRLYDFGRTAASVRAARADRDATMAGVGAERTAVAVEVRAAYLAWLSTSATRAILAQSATDAAARRASVEAHVAEGARPGAELAAARYDEARAALDLERSEGELTAARLELEQASGVALSTTAEPDLGLLDRTAPAPSGAEHPEVRALERRREAASASAEAHGAPFAPVIAAGVDAGLHGVSAIPFPLYQAGVSISVPLLDGGLESASAALASSQATELGALARDAKSRVRLGQERARTAYERSDRRLALARTLVAAAEEAVQHATDQHELGAGSFDAVVQARLQLSRARLEVLAARVDRARAVLELTAPPAR